MGNLTASGSGGGGVLAPPRPGRSRRSGLPPVEPPDGWGGDDGFGSGDGDDDEPPRRERPAGTAELALGFGLVGVGTVFVVFLGAAFLLRKHATEWPTSADYVPPDGLWFSSFALFLSSVALESARRAVDGRAMVRSLAGTLFLGALFLGTQAWIWRGLWRDGLEPSSDGYGTTFYSLTGLHALHVLVGMVLLAVRYVRTSRSEEPLGTRAGVRLVAIYWHFMSGLWIAIFVALYAL